MLHQLLAMAVATLPLPWFDRSMLSSRSKLTLGASCAVIFISATTGASPAKVGGTREEARLSCTYAFTRRERRFGSVRKALVVDYSSAYNPGV